MIQVYAPASIGNFAVGFDALGAAIAPTDGSLLGDLVKVSASTTTEFVCSGPYAHKLPAQAEQNLAYMCLQHFKQAVAPDMPAVRLELVKNLPVGSGLGSSACSVVATIAALDKFAGTGLSDEALIELMADFEAKVSGGRHYDNITPCYLGGLQLTAELIPGKSLAIMTPDNWYPVVAFPGFTLNTAKARAVLPKQLDMHHSVEFAQRLSAFCTLMLQQRSEEALSIMIDTVAEPYRAQLIEGFSAAQQALLQLGAKAVSISGAGPTLFALCDNLASAELCQQWLSDHYINEQGFSHICQLDWAGTRELNEELG
ncbi:homoserine kinase [Pseudoalteromonas sp. T1lg75]|uniref:homoserine kinase n=1 Tax=Pseudoalteromonas sp. T1lg75 TaxID=2077102 RepID=UPI000CF6B0D9|nr:homoserine kinase [Pseudoalteromonas sp. T1lg75]